MQLDGVTLEQALNQIMTMNQLSYKVLSERSIFVFPDTPPKHAQYDEQVVRTFYLSHADATEMSQMLSTIIRLPGIAVQPAIAANKTANTITVRGTAPVVQILEKIIEQNDKPRAEIVVDVEILEVDRKRAKTYGLNLSEYALGGVFSPEVSPSARRPPHRDARPTPGHATQFDRRQSGVRSPPPFNLNTISRGVSTADFYLAVPTAIVRFLEADTHTKLIAKPQLRGAEGTKLTLKLGDQIPVISTSYTPIATGGAGVNPLSSYQYKDVGVNIDMTPRVTLEGDILLDLTVDNSSVGQDVSVAGQRAVVRPAHGDDAAAAARRRVEPAGRSAAEDERKALTGFPGAIHVPVLKQLFSANDNSIDQTDIVMLLTPHIVRTHEITEDDLKPIYIGSQQNLGVGGPPPLIAPRPPKRRGGSSRRRHTACSRPPAIPPQRDCRSASRPMRRRARRPRWDNDALGNRRRAARHARRCRAPCSCRRSPPPRRRTSSTSTRRRIRPSRRRRAATAPPAPAQPPQSAAPPMTSPGVGSAQVMISLRRDRRSASARGRTPCRISITGRAAALDDHADADLRSDEAARADRAGGQLHARGRRQRRRSRSR